MRHHGVLSSRNDWLGLDCLDGMESLTCFIDYHSVVNVAWIAQRWHGHRV